MIEKEAFNEYIELFKKLPLQNKMQRVNTEAKKTLALIAKLKQAYNIKSDDILFNRELVDLNEKEVSSDDFVEAMLVYMYSIQESIATYINEINIK